MQGLHIMSIPPQPDVHGLESVSSLLHEVWGRPVKIRPGLQVLGYLPHVGGALPLPSSAARLEVGGPDCYAWIPAPLVAGDAPATVYLHGGREYILPIVRLFDESQPDSDAEIVEYLDMGQWLHDALTRWRFPTVERSPTVQMSPLWKNGENSATVLEALGRTNYQLRDQVRAVARVVFFALWGSAKRHRLRALGLELPKRVLWMRPVPSETTSFHRRSLRSLVITARVRPPAAERSSGSPAVPTAYLLAKHYRIQPEKPRDWGIDPVHTPEGKAIRLIGHLGADVSVKDRRLHAESGTGPHLSSSTASIPFRQYDDPRRLLMAANMQTQAIPISEGEGPMVRAEGNLEEPPGTNLRVGYIAWNGLNHEDAWVISASAAKKLGTHKKHLRTMFIRAVEIEPDVLVQPKQEIELGKPLIKRRVIPLLLNTNIRILYKLRETTGLLSDNVAAEWTDFSPCCGTVTKVDKWDLWNPESLPEEIKGAVFAKDITADFRMVIRIETESHLPLEVGDKLANRHGHKGIVGAILPDDQMPQWEGKPLEALVDPISVINRAAWGQVYETVAGGLLEKGFQPLSPSLEREELITKAKGEGADSLGRWFISPPEADDWLQEDVRGIVGVQFVMRLPHHAREQISASSGAVPSRRARRHRLTEMDQWALWAHGCNGATREDTSHHLTDAAKEFQRLLAAAGYEFSVNDESLAVELLPLHKLPKAGLNRRTIARLAEMTRTKACKEFDTNERPIALIFSEPVVLKPNLQSQQPAGPNSRKSDSRQEKVKWLYISPASDRQSTWRSGMETRHELTEALDRVICFARRIEIANKDKASKTYDPTETPQKLQKAVRTYLATASDLAVGQSGIGPKSSKMSVLRRNILSHRIDQSGRATIAPGSCLKLGLDEIGLPLPVARAVLGKNASRISQKEVSKRLKDRWAWVKRDPVLHRFGILQVRCRVVEGNVIRLPASLLGPMGADYDGDTAVVFGGLRGITSNNRLHPSANAYDSAHERPMFSPGKAYLYGLYLLQQDPKRITAFQDALSASGAPAWDARRKDPLRDWLPNASGSDADGAWWAILEEHALAALSQDPAMSLGLYDAPVRIEDLPVCKAGAAKGGLYAEQAEPLAKLILSGKSLSIYTGNGTSVGTDTVKDPIEEVMVTAKLAIGDFGGVLRRLIYTLNSGIHPEDIRNTQYLTERFTQKALSVKAGTRPVSFKAFDYHLTKLLQKEWRRGDVLSSDTNSLSSVDMERAEVEEELGGKHLSAAWDSLQEAMADLGEPESPWLTWMRKPHKLTSLLMECGGELTFPLDDRRARPWFK
jgi:hypothetical protein